MSRRTKKPCMHCGKPASRGKDGEHIIPKSLGGGRTLIHCKPEYHVCKACNSGTLGDIDRELVSRSFLAIAASQCYKPQLWRLWSVDESSNNLLVESKPIWDGMKLGGIYIYPQLVFEKDGVHVRGEPSEMTEYGQDNFFRTLAVAAKSAFDRHLLNRRSGIFYDKVDPEEIETGMRLAPRLYSPKTISEIESEQAVGSFNLRFISEAEKRFALAEIEKLGATVSIKSSQTKRLAQPPRIATTYIGAKVIRALFKIALNCVASECPSTPVNRDSFGLLFKLIGSSGGVPAYLFDENGFLPSGEIQEIKASDNAHSLRLTHDGREWNVFFSFFGGRLGAFVKFPGPNHESWRTLDVVAPLESKEWSRKSRPGASIHKVAPSWDIDGAISEALNIKEAWRNIAPEASGSSQLN